MKALDKLLGGQQNLIGIVLLALLVLVVFPLTLDAFRLNMVGKYLTYAFVAVGLVLCWGYGGILSLGRVCSSASAVTAWRCSSSWKPPTPRAPKSNPHRASRTSWTGTRSPNCPGCGSRFTVSASRW